MDVARANFRLDDIYLFPIAQFTQDAPDFCFILFEKHLPAVLGRKHYVVLAIPLCMCQTVCYCQYWLTLFLQGYQCLSCSIHRFIISLSPGHRGKSVIGGAYPPIVPIADEVSPDQGFQFLGCQFLSVVAAI